ncbi:MAG: sensor histidine kinase [Fodinibius sp.]|nr:sensor histidine kinase [Fodinibius sp.]
MLVKGSGKVIEKGSTDNGKYVRISPSDTSRASMMVYVSNFHNLNKRFDFSVLGIGDEISVTGIVSEYNPEYPNKRTFKLFLRTPDDLSYSSLPRYYWLMGGGVMVLAILFIGGWILMLRRQVEKQTKEIQRSLQEKDALLREIHHRVKNSLSIVSGLIGLQIDSTEDRAAQNVLQDSQSRIQSGGNDS